MNVISFISSWLKDIVVLFILISIAELIMPKGNMKKYINLVTGLLIIFTIISPFAKLIKLDFSLDKAVFNYSKSKDFEMDSVSDFYLQQEKQIEKIYKEKISKEIIELVEGKTNYKIVDIVVGILDEEENYGEIDYLNIIIGQKNNGANTNKISIEKITPIEIQDNSRDSPVSNNEYGDLKELISSNYSVGKDKITIKNHEKGKGE